MNRFVGFGLVVGLAIGMIGGALIAKAKRPVPPPPAVAPAPLLPPPAPPPPALDPQIEKLQSRIAELEEKLAAKPSTPEAPPAPTAPAEAGKPRADWKQKLDELLKKGVQAYKGEDFLKAVADLKANPKEGLAALVDRLLKSESASERFLAAALMEDLDDPAAISSLAKALADDDDLLVRRMASHAIALIENEAGLPALRAAMTADADWGVRVNAAYGVAKLGQADGIKMLEDSYGTTPVEYKLAVLGALSDVASPSSAPVFKKVLAESTDITALFITIGAVEKLKDASFVTELNRIASDPKYASNIREMARKAAESLAK